MNSALLKENCEICVHKLFNINQGYLCNLTKARPQFDGGTCPNLEIDKDKVKVREASEKRRSNTMYNNSSSDDESEPSESKASSWLVWILILLFLNFLSYILDWPFWIY